MTVVHKQPVSLQHEGQSYQVMVLKFYLGILILLREDSCIFYRGGCKNRMDMGSLRLPA